MLHLKKILNPRPQANEKVAERDTRSRAGFTEKQLSPARRLDFTKHLAFSFDDRQFRMVAVRRTGTRRNIFATESLAIPENLSEAADRQSFIADRIRLLVSRWGRGTRRVSLVLSGRETAFRSFLMPAMKGRDLRHAVGFEARKQLPFPSEHCRLGYRVTSRLVQKDGPPRLRLALHAATTDYVALQLTPFQMAGIDVHDVCHAPDITGLLLRELPDNRHAGQGCTVIDVERQACRISFYRSSALQFSLISSVGTSPLGEYPDEMRLEAFADSLIQEIQTSQDYYLGQFGQGLTSKVYLGGDTKAVEGLCKLLDRRSNLHFAPFPIEKLPISIPSDSEPRDWLGMLPLIGAAGSAYRGVNLLPPKDLRRLSEKRVGRWVRAAAVMFGISLMAGWGVAEYRSDIMAERAHASEQRLTRLKESDVYRTYHALKRQITADQAYLDLARKVPTTFNLALKDISRIVPGSITLTSMQFLPSEPELDLSIAGIVKSSQVPPEVILAEFVADMNASPFFAGVTILRHTKDRVDGGFTLEFSLGMQAVGS